MLILSNKHLHHASRQKTADSAEQTTICRKGEKLRHVICTLRYNLGSFRSCADDLNSADEIRCRPSRYTAAAVAQEFLDGQGQRARKSSTEKLYSTKSSIEKLYSTTLGTVADLTKSAQLSDGIRQTVV